MPSGSTDYVVALTPPSRQLVALAAGQRDGLSILEGWRYDQFGHEALDLVEGRVAFAVVNGKLRMTRTEETAS